MILLKIAVKVAFQLLLLLGVISLLVIALLATETGSRILVRTLLPYVPGQLQIGRVHGALAGTLQIDDLQYHYAKQSLAIKRVAWVWHPALLLQPLLDIERIAISGAVIHYSGTETAESAATQFRLPLPVHIKEVLLQNVTYQGQPTIPAVKRLRFTAAADAQGMHVRDLELDAPPVALTLQAEASLPDFRAIKIHSQWHYRDAKLGEFAGAGSIQGSSQQWQLDHALEKPFKLATRGPIRFDGKTPKFDLQGDWQALRWPLQGSADYFSKQGTYRISGTTEAYRADVKGIYLDAHAGPLQLNAQAQGGAQQLQVQNLSVAGTPGRLKLQGKLNWANGLVFDADVAAGNLQIQPWLPAWPGHLNARFSAQGRIDGSTLTQAQVVVQQLDGKLRGYPLSAGGQFVSRGQEITMQQVQLRSGSNRLQLDGSIAERAQLEFVLDAPRMAGLWPGLQGALKASGKIGGNIEQPQINAVLDGRNAGYGGTAVKQLAARVAIDMRPQGEVSARIDAKHLQVAGQHLAAVHFDADGSLQSHRLLLEVQNDVGQLKSTLQGGYQARRWAGTVAGLDLQNRLAGPWRLEHPAALSAAFDPAFTANVAGLCLQSQQQRGRMCGEAAYVGAQGYHAQGVLENLPLALLQPQLPENLNIDGLLGGHFELGEQRGVFQVKANIDAQPGVIALRDDENRQQRFSYDNAYLRLDGEDKTFNLNYALGIKDTGTLDGNLRVDAQQQLQGRLHARMHNLRLLAAALPAVENLAGKLSADAHFAGTLQQPQLHAELLFADGRAQVPDLGIELEAMRLRAVSQGGKRVAIDGEARSGFGKLTLVGEALLDAEQGWPLQIAVRGEQFQAARIPEAEVLIAPDLVLQAGADGATLSGKLLVPEAHFHINQLPASAIRVSEDQILEGAELQNSKSKTKPNRPPQALALRVEVLLGEKVDFEGYGLKTELEGGVEVRKNGEKTSAHGEVKMRNGKYKAYGQHLSIERGRFIFAGAADNPALDIRASRVSKTDQVTAILQVTGSLQKPLTQVSSEPPLAQEQALAYLLTGRALNSANATQRAVLAQAALSYGLEYTQPLTEFLGIDEVDVESDGTLTGSSLILGKYLTPDLYVSYVSNIFNNSAIVALRYRLSKSFSVETHTGTSHGLDFLYNIEVD